MKKTTKPLAMGGATVIKRQIKVPPDFDANLKAWWHVLKSGKPGLASYGGDVMYCMAELLHLSGQFLIPSDTVLAEENVHELGYRCMVACMRSDIYANHKRDTMLSALRGLRDLQKGRRHKEQAPLRTEKSLTALIASVQDVSASANVTAVQRAPVMAHLVEQVPAPPVLPWKIGDRVLHQRHGEGTITKIGYDMAASEGYYMVLMDERYDDAGECQLQTFGHLLSVPPQVPRPHGKDVIVEGAAPKGKKRAREDSSDSEGEHDVVVISPERHALPSSEIVTPPAAREVSKALGAEARLLTKKKTRGANRVNDLANGDLHNVCVEFFSQWNSLATAHAHNGRVCECTRLVVIPPIQGKSCVAVTVTCLTCHFSTNIPLGGGSVRYSDKDGVTHETSNATLRMQLAFTLSGGGYAQYKAVSMAAHGYALSETKWYDLQRTVLEPAVRAVASARADALYAKVQAATALGYAVRLIMDARHDSQGDALYSTTSLLLLPAPAELLKNHPHLAWKPYEILWQATYRRGTDVEAATTAEAKAATFGLDVLRRKNICVASVGHDENKEVTTVVCQARNCRGEKIKDELDL
jgi:hypothetical protein